MHATCHFQCRPVFGFTTAHSTPSRPPMKRSVDCGKMSVTCNGCAHFRSAKKIVQTSPHLLSSSSRTTANSMLQADDTSSVVWCDGYADVHAVRWCVFFLYSCFMILLPGSASAYQGFRRSSCRAPPACNPCLYRSLPSFVASAAHSETHLEFVEAGSLSCERCCRALSLHTGYGQRKGACPSCTKRQFVG